MPCLHAIFSYPWRKWLTKAALLAGGHGSRLYPLTSYVPKCMIPIGGKPFLDYVFDYLKKHGVTDVVLLASNDDGEVYRNYYGDGDRIGVRVSYSIAARTGTAGALHDAEGLFTETFIVYYGDVLTDFNLSEMIRFHSEKKSICTIALSRSVPLDFGVGKIDQDGRLIFFKEKPVLPEYPASMGIYVFEPKVLRYCGHNLDIASDVIPKLIQDRLPVHGYVTDRIHYDIGTFKSLDAIKKMLERSSEKS